MHLQFLLLIAMWMIFVWLVVLRASGKRFSQRGCGFGAVKRSRKNCSLHRAESVREILLLSEDLLRTLVRSYSRCVDVEALRI